MSQRTRKAFTCLMVALSLLGIVGAVFGWDFYPTSYHWGFQNYCYLGFNQAMNFTDDPHQGASYDSSLVGYWNLNEGQGAVAHDSSGNSNNGTITGASWVDGKYGKALSFDGSYRNCQNVDSRYNIVGTYHQKLEETQKQEKLVFLNLR